VELVIDANIFEGYYQENVLGIKVTGLTASPLEIFSNLGDQDFIYFDEGGHILQEWKNLVEPEWFDAWYPKLLAEGGAYEIPTETCYLLRRTLWGLGFPRGKDFWHIRTALSILSEHEETVSS